MSTHDVSRRGFIGGATGAGALTAAFAALGFDGVANAEGEGSGTTAVAGADSALQAQALPPSIPGARVGVANFVDALHLNATTAGIRQFSVNGVFSGAGWLVTPLHLPVGARLLRVDAYALVTASAASVSFALNMTTVGASPSTKVLDFGTPSGLGSLQATYAPTTPLTVEAGNRIYLETNQCTSANKLFLGAIYQYYDANPQLNLLPTPIRVYDSRPGANPASVAKGTLANNETRVIDCTFSGAVPAGAAAAMVTLTLTGTSAGGFMALWRNGLADPGTSSINWDHSGTNVAVTTVVALDAAAKLIARTGPNASTHFIIDVIGFYA